MYYAKSEPIESIKEHTEKLLKNLKLLKIGDEIKYKYENFTKEYKITENVIIKDTDLESLEETEENCITLITCVENEPQYRRCVRGVEILNED